MENLLNSPILTIAAYAIILTLYLVVVPLSLFYWMNNRWNIMGKFEKFASLNGPKYHNLPPNNEKITFIYEPHTIKDFIEIKDNEKVLGKVKSFHSLETLNWKLML